jgi:hypothetical protein
MHEGFFELDAGGAFFFDEVGKHDDVAHDDAGEADNADQAMKPKEACVVASPVKAPMRPRGR